MVCLQPWKWWEQQLTPLPQVYEKGCASISNSVDLWTDYCSFTMDTTHDPQIVRE